MSGYATVEINKLNDRAAKQHLEAPVVVRGNRIRSVTLTIPLLETDRQGRGTYLIVKLPTDTVDELMDRVVALPEEKRSDFLRSWIRENQEAVLSRYFEIRDKGKKTRKFRYDVVPVPAGAPLAEKRKAVPRKAGKARPQPPATKKRTEDLVIVRRDTPGMKERAITLPRGYMAHQREKEADRQKREKAGVLTVSIPVSDPDQVGKELYMSDPHPILYSDPDKGDAKMSVKVRFVGVEQTSKSKKTTRKELTYKVSRFIGGNFTKYLSKEHNYAGRKLREAKDKVRDRVLTIAGSVVSKATGRSKAIREYAP